MLPLAPVMFSTMTALPQQGRQLVDDDARRDIRRGAGRKADEDTDILFGIVRLGERTQAHRRRERQPDDCAHCFHSGLMFAAFMMPPLVDLGL